MGGLLLAGCAVKRGAYDVPKVLLPGKFAQAPAVAESSIATSPARQAGKETPAPGAGAAAGQSGTEPVQVSPLSAVLPEWWRMLGSEELDHLIDQALANNQDLRIASLRVAQLKARMDIAGAAKLPEVSIPVGATVEYPYWGAGKNLGNDVAHTLYQIGLRADWRPDLWGEIASQYDSAKFQLQRVTYQRDDMQRTVVARIVSDYLEYLSLNDRLRVARKTEKTLDEMIQSVKARLESGDATLIDLEQQKTAVHGVLATILTLEQQRIVVRDRIATSVGTVPENLPLSDLGMETTAYPAVLPGIPSVLLLRRPDVRMAEARMLAAEADIDVARSRLLPPLDLTAQAGYGSAYFSKLFTSQTLFWSFVSNLSINVFDSGKRAKEVEFAKSVHEEMVETYVRVLYDAVRDVDDALGAVRNMGLQLEEQNKAAKAAFRNWDYIQTAFNAGELDYLALLDAERTYQRNLDDLYRYKLEAYRGLVNLFSALGGGVHMGGELPGKGNRPAASPQEIDYGALASGGVPGMHPASEVVAQGQDDIPDAANRAESGKPAVRAGTLNVALTDAAPSIGQTEGVDWDGESLQSERGRWLVELSGVFDRGAIFPAWRDLRARFPQLTEGRLLLPRRQGRAGGEEIERESWYRLFISSYPDRQAAEDACAELRAGLLHCSIFSTYLLGAEDPFNANRTKRELAAKPAAAPVATLPVATEDEHPAISKAAEGAPVAPVPPASGVLLQRSAGDGALALKLSTSLHLAGTPDSRLTAGEADGTQPPHAVLPRPESGQFWLVGLPPVQDQGAAAVAWDDLRKRFPGQMKVRTLMVHANKEAGGQARYQLFIARFPEKPMAEEFCGMLLASGQDCSIHSSNEFPQQAEFDASWFTDQSLVNNQDKAGSQ